MLPNPEFYLGRTGIITNGEYAGWTVEVVDDSAGETGGYYILYYNGSEGYDDWLEHRKNLPFYFAETGWMVKWGRTKT